MSYTKWAPLLFALLLMLSACAPAGPGGESNAPLASEPPSDSYITLSIVDGNVAFGDTSIPYIIHNSGSETAQVVLIPRLERKEGEAWVEIPTVDVGFCGTPDTVETERDGSVPLEWFGDAIIPGTYRLSYSVVDPANYDERGTLCAEFDITA